MKNKKKVPKKTNTKKWNNNQFIFFFLITLIILSIVLIILLKDYSKNKDNNQIDFQNEIPVYLRNYSSVMMYLPAVDENDTGYLTTIKIETYPGTGRTLVDIDGLLFWEDTQQSIRKSKYVAEEITGVKTENLDIIYTIKANASLIGGESAGAAITIATIALLENKKIKENVIITGTVNHDGTIGPVNSILSKANASKENGAELFLVPLSQNSDVSYETIEHCEPIGTSEICTTEKIPKRINVSEEVGIKIEEVGTIKEALKYFLED